MSLWTNYWEKVGTQAAQLGTKIGLPEMNVSEALGSTWQPGVFGQEPSTSNNQLRIGPPEIPQPGPQESTTGGGSSDWARYHPGEGAMPAGYGGESGGAPMEQPAGSGWEEIFNSAQGAYDQLANTLQSGLAGSLEMIGQEAATTRAGYQSEEARRVADYGQQQLRETQEAEEAERSATGKTTELQETATSEFKQASAEQRRQLSELQQGIQAKYGGTTGTGKFVSEIMGSKAMQNLGAYRSDWQTALTGYARTLQDTLSRNKSALEYATSQINNAISNVKDEVFQKIAEVDTWASNAKIQARNQVNQYLAEIGVKRADQRMGVVKEYNSYIQDINQRNTSYRQDLYNTAQTQAAELAKLKAKATTDYQASIEDLPKQNALLLQRLGISVYPEHVNSFMSGQELPGSAYYIKGAEEEEDENNLPLTIDGWNK